MGSTQEEIDDAVPEQARGAEVTARWEDATRRELPAHRTELEGFWMAKTEVTVGQWRSVMGSAPNGNKEGEDHPVVAVGWDDCDEFCHKAGLLLPTEAQWEYAARGPDSRIYPWGDPWNRSLCQSGEDPDGTAAAGSFPDGASWCGALDMAGNALEWCRDWYDEGFYESSHAARPDPECRDSSSGQRVLRGGCWVNNMLACRSACRLSASPARRDSTFGLRPLQMQ